MAKVAEAALPVRADDQDSESDDIETRGALKPLRKRARRGLLVGVCVAMAAIVGLLLMVGPTLKSPAQVAADATPPTTVPITAKLEKRSLSSHFVMRAVVNPGQSTDVKPSDALIAAAPVVTALPAADGTTLSVGTVVVEANGEPLIAMNWPFPAYRDLHSKDTGPDVVQLQKTLSSLGYASGGSGVFDAATQKGLAGLYKDLGYTVPLTSGGGTQAVDPSSPKGSQSNSPSSGSVTPEVYLPARDVVAMPTATAKLTSVPLKVGQKIGTADVVLAKLDGQIDSVVATTTPDRSGRVAVGDTATLTAGTVGQQYTLKVTAVAPGVGDVQGLGSGVRIDLSFTDPGKIAPVSPKDTTYKLEITTGADAPAGLVLPITAIYSTPDGNSFLIPANDQQKNLTVTLGATVDGWVEIKPNSELKEGDEFVLGSRRSG